MEEVDSIILHFLRQLNINIDNDVKSLCNLTVEAIIESVSKCLVTINPSLKVPTKLPSGISHRIEVAAQIAALCKDVGYKNDVGYQTFLYYNESDLRQVFMFLIERLPSEGKQSTTKSLDSNKKSQIMQDISRKISEDMRSIWIPPCCHQQNQTLIGDFKSTLEFRNNSPNNNTLREEEIVKQILLIRNFSNVTALTECVEDKKQTNTVETASSTTEVPNYDVNMSLKELKETAFVLRQKLDMLESERNVMNVEYSQVLKSCEKAEADLQNVINILDSVGISDIDSEFATNSVLKKVQQNIQMLHKKSEELTSRNISLKVEIDKIKYRTKVSMSDKSQCAKLLTQLKETAKGMKDEYKDKEDLKDHLKRSYDKLKGGNKRSIYTKRILEIISNVDKQNIEIQRIIDDTRQLQKEINSLEGQLDRCFSIADETLFRDAKKDDQAKKAYKLLALLHSECNTIVSLVNDTGILARDIIDLEDNIKAEKSKRTEDTLQKIQVDLSRMQNEAIETNH